MDIKNSMDEITNRINEIGSLINDPANAQIIKRAEWIAEFDREIENLINGFKKMCFDEGSLSLFDVKSKEFRHLWKRLKNPNSNDYVVF